MRECNVCTEREAKVREYEEKIEKEKVEACLKALEREKVAKGIRNSRKEEILLRQHQKQQIEERRMMEKQQQEVENTWHEVLVDAGRRKEYLERREFERRQKETQERRLAYDEQIISANKKRRELIRAQKEEENKRLDQMKIKMEQDHYDAIKRKKEQQDTNKHNYIESHQIKVARIRSEREKERHLDNKMIKAALEELRQERERKVMELASFRKEQEWLIQQRAAERHMTSSQHARAAAAAAGEGRERGRLMENEKSAQEYQSHLSKLKSKMDTDKLDHTNKMAEVRRTAFKELQNKYNDANEEIKRQIVYRNKLNEQIRDNQKQMEIEQITTEQKQNPFTKKAMMFKDVMNSRMQESQARTSTNPIHPFQRRIEAQRAQVLPSISQH